MREFIPVVVRKNGKIIIERFEDRDVAHSKNLLHVTSLIMCYDENKKKVLRS